MLSKCKIYIRKIYSLILDTETSWILIVLAVRPRLIRLLGLSTVNTPRIADVRNFVYSVIWAICDYWKIVRAKNTNVIKCSLKNYSIIRIRILETSLMQIATFANWKKARARVIS